MSEQKTHAVVGGGGIKLNVEETGNDKGPAVLFIHGYSQCRLAWRAQMESELGNDLRLVAMDIRGHGFSEKPKDAYGDSKLWADDVQAVINALELDHPVLSGWSYGGFIICDYVRHHGEDAVGGYNLVGAVTRMNVPEFEGTLSQQFLDLVPGFFSTDCETAINALTSFIKMCTAKAPTEEELYAVLGYNVVVPPHVREALFSRQLLNDDVLKSMRKPALLTHGEQDAIVLVDTTARVHAELLPNARLSLYSGIGHAPFIEDPERFNRELREFAIGVAGAEAQM